MPYYLCLKRLRVAEQRLCRKRDGSELGKRNCDHGAIRPRPQRLPWRDAPGAYAQIAYLEIDEPEPIGPNAEMGRNVGYFPIERIQRCGPAGVAVGSAERLVQIRRRIPQMHDAAGISAARIVKRGQSPHFI